MSSRGGKKKSTKTSRSAKAGVIFPVGRMLRYIKKGHPKYRIGVGAPVYMAAVLEYLTEPNHLPNLKGKGNIWNKLESGDQTAPSAHLYVPGSPSDSSQSSS
ncbi:hypothetical protein J1605_014754 [Eschrichtius robustus]|uniref:Histone H2A n=1 Tax=Eschrichtius robustus TaxID=9764 RepID=A0AB34GBX5_ESCRO|nr:hypothetical protein J1605_014754 [Eschrichtius robustus]